MSKLQIIKSIPEHFYNIEIQEAQAFCKEQFTANNNYAIILCTQSVCYTGITEDGTIVGIMGLSFIHKNSAEGWGIFSPYMKKYLKEVILGVRNFLKDYKHVKRIQCSASVKYPEAHKLLTKSFGFKPEAILEKWDCLGNTHILYTIINGDLKWLIK